MGNYTDISIVEDELIEDLNSGERDLADAGYANGMQHSETPNGYKLWSENKSKVHARHEPSTTLLKLEHSLKTILSQ